MFRISDFSRFTRVTLKTLRHYDRLGLLRPARVDPDTRYRWYSARQVARLQRILALRELGFSLEHIGALLDEDPRSATLHRLLEMRRVELRRQLDDDRRRLDHVEARLRELDQPHAPPALEAVVHALPAVKVASRRGRVADLADGAQRLFEAVEADASRAGVRAAGPPVMLYHDRDHRESGADLEAAVPIAPDARRAGRSAVRMLPAVPRAACVTYAGSYEQWGDTMRGLLGWLQARRMSPAGPLREVYLQFGIGDADDLRLPASFLAERAEDQVTEMQIPVRSR